MPKRIGLLVPPRYAEKLDAHVLAGTNGCRSRGEFISAWISADYIEARVPAARPGDFRDARGKISGAYSTNERGQYLLVFSIPNDQAEKLATLAARTGTSTNKLVRRVVEKHLGDNTPMPALVEHVTLPQSLVSDLRALAEIQDITLEALTESVLRAALTDSLL